MLISCGNDRVSTSPNFCSHIEPGVSENKAGLLRNIEIPEFRKAKRNENELLPTLSLRYSVRPDHSFTASSLPLCANMPILTSAQEQNAESTVMMRTRTRVLPTCMRISSPLGAVSLCVCIVCHILSQKQRIFAPWKREEASMLNRSLTLWSVTQVPQTEPHRAIRVLEIILQKLRLLSYKL